MEIITIANKKGECWKNGSKGPRTYKSVESAEKAIKAELSKQKWLHIGLFSNGHYHDGVEIYGKVEADRAKKDHEQQFRKIKNELSKCKVKVNCI